jgi:hypothetical protein
MEIFSKYLEKHCNYGTFIEIPPSNKLKIVIVIPCHNEPDIIKALKSILNCKRPVSHTEIIVVINSSTISSDEIKFQNSISIKEINQWIKENNSIELNTYLIIIEDIAPKTAGVGFARKTGMDEAIRRFIQSNQKSGIISCFDADSIVDDNYLIEIEKLFNLNPKCNGCSIYFEHPIESNEFSSEIVKRIVEYELFLRYYKNALQFIDFPYFHFTVGSSFAVSALAYCKVGGMNKKQAGEDFYFLQKVMPLGDYIALNSTCVYPSPRPSDRVPFGTGAFISQYLANPEREFLTYNFEAFLVLKQFVADIDLFYNLEYEALYSIISKYHDSLKEFLIINKFEEALININSNSAHLKSFRKRFFEWFDAFKILKFLNFAHENYFEKDLVLVSLKSYLYTAKKSIPENIKAEHLLKLLRVEERSSII